MTTPHRISTRQLVPWLVPTALLVAAYGLLVLTLTEQLSHSEIMQRCVLVDPNLARIWSVSNVEVGLSYLGVFGGMLYYFLGLYRRSSVHLTDMGLALSYLIGSFTLDFVCVRLFEPFVAMLIGDAVVMTFTVIVSRQTWFQRLLGVFVPLVFLTCGIGHFLEGSSYWFLTYPVNVPWTMVTADIGFAVLVNSARFPAFIRGEDVVEQLARETERVEELEREILGRLAAEQALTQAMRKQRGFLQETLLALTEGHLHLCYEPADLPTPLPRIAEPIPLAVNSLRTLRRQTDAAAAALQMEQARRDDLETAVGEAGMNAVVHAGRGTAEICSDAASGVVQVWIRDDGSGIGQDVLHRAILERGFTTAGTLGHGFYIMLNTADRLYLLTGPGGTTVVIEQERTQPEPAWLKR